MALPQIISRNITQKIPDFALNVRKVLSGGTDGDFYTCPTGKKAIITGQAVCTGLGAAATVNLQFIGITVHQWDAATAASSDKFLTEINTYYNFRVELAAAEVMRYTQNSGTNAEMNVNCTIQESAA